MTATTSTALLPPVTSPSPTLRPLPLPPGGAAPASASVSAAPQQQQQQQRHHPLPSPLRQYEVALSRLLLPLPHCGGTSDDDSSTTKAATRTETHAAVAGASAPPSSPPPSAASLLAMTTMMKPPPKPKPTYYALPPSSSASGRRRHGARFWRQPTRRPAARPGEKVEDAGGSSSSPRAQEHKHRRQPNNMQQDDHEDCGDRSWGEGQIADPVRAEAKDRQVDSILACLDRCLQKRSRDAGRGGGSNEDSSGTRRTRRRLTIADLGAGSGHLAIPAALRHPRHRVVAVDLSRRSLDLMKIKAARVAVEDLEAARKQRQMQMQEERQCRRVDENCEDDVVYDDDYEYDSDDPDDFLAANPLLPLERTAISNLYALCGPIERYLLLSPDDDNSTKSNDTSNDGDSGGGGGGGGDHFEERGRLRFQVGLALHLCGQSTDVAIRACVQQNAALVAAPCCVGKIQTTRRNPYVWQATQSNLSSIRYPQSVLYQQLLRSGCGGSCGQFQSNEADAEEDSSTSLLWNALACAADDSTRHLGEAGIARGHDVPAGGVVNDEKGERGNDDNAGPVPTPPPSDIGSSDTRHRRSCCRAAKVLVEWDRCLYLRERGYRTWLTRMVPASASPKHDIIVAVPKARTRSSTTLTDRLRTSSNGIDDGEGTTAADDMDDPSDGPFLVVDHDAVMDLERTREYLQAALDCAGGKGQAEPSHAHGSPERRGEDGESNGAWAHGEVAQVRDLLVTHFALNDSLSGGMTHTGNRPSHDPHGGDKSSDVYYFPTGMGRGRRKLIHYVAGTLGLEHWSHGKKQGTGKTVAVALPWTRRRMQNGNSDTAPGRSKPTQ